MAAELFVDTSAWFALADSGTPGRDRVESALRDRLKLRHRIVTTNLIIAETHALLMRRASRTVALTFVQTIVGPQNVVVSSTPDLERAARERWLAGYSDQDFSFTDAVSFAVMTQRKISDALTLDHHFSVAGFTVVPTAK